jgi:hypothetical protein
MLRFVVLYHECPAGYERTSHWDLMLESGDKLRTWALATLPASWGPAKLRTEVTHPARYASSGDLVGAQQLGEHRLAYLEYEGPLTGNRGSVARIDAGEYKGIVESPSEWQVELSGSLLKGRMTLRRTEPDSNEWTLSCEADR